LASLSLQRIIVLWKSESITLMIQNFRVQEEEKKNYEIDDEINPIDEEDRFRKNLLRA
jgi:hypothetical protein